jgi:transketolase
MRCCEQIKVNLGYMEQKICMVGIASGLALGTLGYTHCCIEDVGILRSIPGITIISPADSLETVKALEAAIKSESPSYLRLTGTSNNPIIYNEDYEYKIGKSITLREGKDITIFCAGAMVYQSLEAAKILESKKIYSKVVNMHTIKPIDKIAIEEACNSKLIVSIEEHNVIGGLGSAIAEYKSSLNKSPKQLFLGIKDTYGKGGNYKFLQEKHRLTADKIVEDILLNR